MRPGGARGVGRRMAVLVALVALVFGATAASAQMVASASVAPGGPHVTVAAGLGGVSSWTGCSPIRVMVVGGSQPLAATVRIRVANTESPVWAVDVQAEPGARREISIVACTERYGGVFEWALDDGGWSPANAVIVERPAVAVVGERVGRLLALEAALSAGAPDPSLRTATLTAATAPEEPAAWETADIVVVDATEFGALSAQARSALLRHGARGATIVLAGLDLPADAAVFPGLPGAVRSESLPTADGSVSLPVRDLDLVGGATRLGIGGQARAFTAGRRFGDGRLVMLGLDLGEAAALAVMDADAWTALLGAGVSSAFVAPSSRWESLVELTLRQRVMMAGAHASLISPLAGAVALVIATLAAAVALAFMGGKSPDRVGPRQVALVLLAVSAPLLLAGLVRRSSRVIPMTLVEHWEGTGMSRVVTWTVLASNGEVPLPLGVSSVQLLSAIPRDAPPVTFQHRGAETRVRSSVVPRFGAVVARTESWRDEPLSPRVRFEVDDLPRSSAPPMGPKSIVERSANFDDGEPELLTRLMPTTGGAVAFDRGAGEAGADVVYIVHPPRESP